MKREKREGGKRKEKRRGKRKVSLCVYVAYKNFHPVQNGA
jgi:hypothetical protein